MLMSNVVPAGNIYALQAGVVMHINRVHSVLNNTTSMETSEHVFRTKVIKRVNLHSFWNIPVGTCER